MSSEPDAAPSPTKSPRRSSPSKRSRATPTPISIPSQPSTSAIADEPANPPSPVPTEIIDIEAEDFVRTAQSYGVKVRDYAVEPPTPPLPRIPEMWKNPFVTLLAHDMHIRRPRDASFWLSGRILRRLLDIGFVTQEEADVYWTLEDHRLLKEYDQKPQSPYPYVVGYRRPKPTAAYRVAARKAFYGSPRSGDIPEAYFTVPDGTWEGDAESRRLEKQARENRMKALRMGLAAPVQGLDPRPPPPPPPPREPTPEPAQSTEPNTPIATPPIPSAPLPEDGSPHRSPSGLLGSSSRANAPATPTAPAAPATPTTPTTPPATAAPLPSTGSRRLGRTTTMHTIVVR
ncbi:hypothetical protein PsYK624_068180 [Phanerochaete sordida]|uniref:Uncharacterized protein n=1 Tax=Phanerochaete sordida TaxID=48140 RepID=A0A9P3GA99_9APHY|nr:hypothetical protein PsYK624_068180 [Phanerochaete sordida]